MPLRPSALLFDVDGVLLGGGSVYLDNWVQWATARGIDPVRVLDTMHGRRPEDIVAQVAPDLDVTEELAFLTALLASSPPLPAMPGAVELLGALPAHRWAIVTSSRERHVRRSFAAAGLPVPSVAIFADDVANGKPAPDGYRMAATRLRADPATCIVIEDAPAGIESGRSAGCMVVAVATTHERDELGAADAVFDTLADAASWLRAAAGVEIRP